MKAILLPLAALLFPVLVSAQECGTGRYSTYGYFPQIDSIPGVVFGTNTGVDGTQQTLRMDIYAPANDPLTARPVVVVAFGGSFVTGSRADMASMCGQLARLGYVAVAIDYRVGFFFPSTNTTMHAVQRCVHDLKGSIRYLRKTVAEDGNPYGIDPDRIIVGGVSAGAIGALHATYMDQPSELPAQLVADSAVWGGMEGNSGPLGYSSDVMACFSMSGALMDTTWVQPGDQPYCGIHETGDGVVPCYTEEAYALGLPTGIIVSGDHDINIRMESIGVPSCYLEYPGNGHVGYLQYDPVNSLNFVVQFLASVACDLELDCSGATVAVNEHLPTAGELVLYPVPAKDAVTLEIPEAATVRVLDAQGRVMLEQLFSAGQNQLGTAELPNGIYLVRTEGTTLRTARLVIAR
ncbi:MAG: carboxylesterase family protein [Flavobacteriales bacterium]|nr:carboxylesterase family protein [Flavobacteriales bacterium]